MAFTRPTLTELVNRIRQDFLTRVTEFGAILRRSTVYVLSYVLAGAAHLLHGHLDYLARQIFPDQSDGEFFLRQAALFGVTQNPATYATGNVTLTGSNGTVVQDGATLLRSDGVAFVTTADATIASGTATVAVKAVDAGAAGNTDVGVVLSFESPVAGVDAAATVATGGLSGGTNAENLEDHRARFLERLRNPPQGGASSDYSIWAKQVSGVTRAWVFPLQLGAGTVVVYFVRDGDSGSIIPDAGEVTAVQNYINNLRPVTAAVTVQAPTAVTRNFTIHPVPDNATIRAAIEAELKDLLARQAPGQTLLYSQVKVAVGLAAGVTDFTVSVPSADVVYTTGQLPVFGTVTWN